MSATLRLPEGTSLPEKWARVDEIIGLLGLGKARDTKIGTPDKKGISGGERKRTAIAMEMVTDPAVLFLDEPTSGLDTFTAYSVVSQLRDLARAGRTVVATIHQPSSKTFMLFDDLLLLAEGRVIYHGPVSEVLAYFATLGHTCPSYMNPADFLFMEVLNEAEKQAMSASDSSVEVAVIGAEAAHGTVTSGLISSWKGCQAAQDLHSEIEQAKQASLGGSAALGAIVAHAQKTRASFGTQFGFLATRVARNMLRNKMVLFARIMRSIFMGLMMSSIYYDLASKKGYAQTQDRISALFFICTNELFSSVGNSVFQFSAERGVFLREHNNGYYSVMSYFLSKTLLEVPLSFLSPWITISIMYPLVGFRPSWPAYAAVCLSGQLMSLVGSAIGLMLGGLFPDFQMAMSLMPAITLPMMIFGGLQVNLDSIPWYFKFMPVISPVRYAFSSLAQTEFSGLKFTDCQPGIPCSGDDVLKIFAMDNDPSVLQNWLILLMMFALFTAGGLFFMWRATKK